MRPPVVVAHPSLIESDPTLRQAQEQLTVEQLVAKSLGNETGRPTVVLDVEPLLGSRVGQPESNIRA